MSISEKLTTVYENIPKVYEAGEQAQNRAFWDEYLADGKLLLYAFAGYNWTDKNFRPTRNIVSPVESAERIFYVSRLTNIKQSLAECGVTLDLSKATNLNGAFLYSSTRELPALDLSAATNIGNCFNSCSSLRVIDSVKFSQNVTNVSAVFTNCTLLEEIRIDGAIGFSGLDFHWSTKLSADSLASIIASLSLSTKDNTITLPKIAQTTYETKYGSGAWATLLTTRQNWTVAYA